MLQYDKRLKEYSRRLRTNMTDAEKMLWSKIRGKSEKIMEILIRESRKDVGQ